METTEFKKQTTAEPVYLETTLLRVFGVLFCHDAKRARARTGKVEINRGVKEKGITVRFDSEYAQPGPFAYKIALAVIRKQSSFGKPARNTISFSQRELIRMSGRKSWGGKDSEELALALKQIRYTHVLSYFKIDDKFVERDFSIFNEVLIERRSSPTDPIVACTIVIADPIIQSLNDKHFTCLNHLLMQQLGTIGAAFYMRLLYHFSVQYDGHNLSRVVFKKQYADICNEWLGGLTALKHRSRIIKQVGGHLTQLVTFGFLKSFAVTPAESGEGFVISFRPGSKFVADYNTFYLRRTQPDVTFEFNDERHAISEPHQVAYLFIEKKTGRKGSSSTYISSKDVETAREILAHLALKDVPAFLDFALIEAGKTQFDLKTLGGTKQYLNAYMKARDHHVAETRASKARKVEEETAGLELAYNEYRRTTAEFVFSTLSDHEQSEIRALAQAKISSGKKGSDFMLGMFLRLETVRLVADRYPSQIASFEEWKNTNGRP
jgi:hypothetical protein